MNEGGKVVAKMDIWDAEYPKTELRKGDLVSTDRVRGSVRYIKSQYATNDDLEADRKKVLDKLSKKR
jgi:hypothetical protein